MYREIFRSDAPSSLVLAQKDDRLVISRDGTEIDEFSADDGGLKAAVKRYLKLVLPQRPKPPKPS